MVRVRPRKRKRSEGSDNGNENVKKPLLQVTITKVKVSQDQLKRLQKQKLSTKHEHKSNKDEQKREFSATVNNKEASGSSSQITRESPARHRLSNLLDGSVPSPHLDHAVLPDYEDEHVTNINCEGDQFNTAKSLSNPDSVKARLFDSVGNSVDDDSSLGMRDQDCITVPCYSEVVTKTVLHVEGALTEAPSASDTLTADDGVASAQEQCSSEGMDQHYGEKHSSKDDFVRSVPEQQHEPRNAASNSSDVAVTDLPSGILLPGKEGDEDAVCGVFDGKTREKTEPAEDSGCGSMSSSGEETCNSLDYTSGYNTLEVMNSLLSDLTEERGRRAELEERIFTMEERNKDLMTESEKLKELVNDLLHLSKVKAEPVSRGTQINMDLSLRRGRTIDRATSPLRRDPSPDLQLLSFSIGCQTSPDEVEHPKMMSTFCQTDEEVIPPKILVSIASQTDITMPQARVAPQSAFPTQVQQMVMPNVGARAPAQLQSSTYGAQASSMFQAAHGQFHQMPFAMLSQQTFSLQSTQQGQTSVQVNTLSNQLPTQIRASLQHPTTTSRTTGLQSTGYQWAAFSSPLIRTSQPSVGVQYTPSPSANLNQGPSVLSRQTSSNQGLINSNLNAYINAHNVMAQRNSVRSTPQTARQAPQTAYCIAQGNGQAQHVGRQQYSAQPQANSTRTLQQTVDSSAALQSRIIATIEETNRVNKTAANQSARNPGQSSRTAYQQGISPQISLARRTQPPVSQPERQEHPLLRIQGNTVVTSQNQQGSNLNISRNQSAVHGMTMQRSVAQSLAVHPPFHAQGSPLMSQNYQSANLNASMNQSAISGVTVHQSVTQPVTGNVQQLHKQQNTVSVSQNQQGTNLNFPINQTGVAVQQSTQSPPIPALVQTGSSNRYNDTIRQLSLASVERNAAVSEGQLRIQSNAQALSLCDEVRRVYSELQQSLDEITLNKQKQRNFDATNSESSTVTTVPVGVSTVITTPPIDSNSELTITHVTSGNLSDHSRSASVRATPNVTPEGPSYSQVFNSDKTDSNRSSPSASLQIKVGSVHQNGTREHVTCVSSNKDPHRKPPKASNGALEHTVQRLMARCTTSVADVFDGTLKSASVESLQSELGTSNGRSVSLPESQPRNESAQDCSRTLEPDTVEAVSLGQSEKTGKGGFDRQVNSPEDISNSSAEIDGGEGHPVSGKTSSREENMKETGDFLITEEVGKEGATANGCVGESTDKNSDGVFVAPSTSVKRSDDSKKIKDDLYMYLMSPIIPPIATAKRVWPRIPQVETVTRQDVRHVDSSDPENIENDLEFSQSVVETEESLEDVENVDKDKETVADAKQDIAQTKEAVTKTNSADPNVKNGPEVAMYVVGSEEAVEGGDNADEDMENVAETEQSIAGTHQAVTNVGNYDPCVESDPERLPGVVEAEPSADDEDNVVEDMETDAEPKQQSVANVDNANPSVDNDNVLSMHGVEAKESVEVGENANEEPEVGGEPKQYIVGTQKAETNMIIAEPPRSNDKTQQAVTNAENDRPNAEDDSEFAPNVVQTEEVSENKNNADAVTQQDDEDHADLDIGKGLTRAMSIHVVQTEETVADTDNTERNPETTQNSSETDEGTVDTHHGSGSLNNAEDNAQGHAVIPLLSEDDLQHKEHIEAASTSRGFSTPEEIDQATSSTKSSPRNHLSEVRSEEFSKPQVPISHLKLESTLGSCIDGGVLLDNKTVKENQHQKCGLKSEDVSKQDLFHRKSTFHATPTTIELNSISNVSGEICDIEGMKKQPLENRQDPIQSHVNGKAIAGIQVASKTTVDHTEKENAATSDTSQQHVNRSSVLPKPRLAVRSDNDNLVIMWDLPSDNNLTEIEYFELYSWTRSGQWLKIANIKAIELPMGCTVKNIAPGKMFLFAVRAVARNGVTGPFSDTSGISNSQNGQETS